MVIAKLIGGLGNQMFVYSVGKVLSLKRGEPLYIDETWVNKMEKKNNIKLNIKRYFGNLEYKENILVSLFIKISNNKIIRKILKSLKLKGIVIEKEFGYNPKMLLIKSKNLYLYEGYWQSYKYLEGYEELLQKEFEFDKSLYISNREIADKIIQERNSVSIHIRRGDYEKNPKVSQIHGNICNLDYYKKALKEIKNKIKNPYFFIFSDDIKWCKENLKEILFAENYYYVEENAEVVKQEIGYRDKGINDLYLMSLCKNNIIANSSFSWWAAYLNRNKNKIVVAPKRWFNDNKNTQDICPIAWIRI